MNETIKELLKQIPIKPDVIEQNSITFINRHGDSLEISAAADDSTYPIPYRIDYKCGKYTTGTINFFYAEFKVLEFMA